MSSEDDFLHIVGPRVKALASVINERAGYPKRARAEDRTSPGIHVPIEMCITEGPSVAEGDEALRVWVSSLDRAEGAQLRAIAEDVMIKGGARLARDVAEYEAKLPQENSEERAKRFRVLRRSLELDELDGDAKGTISTNSEKTGVFESEEAKSVDELGSIPSER